MITRMKAISILREHIGKSLIPYAKEYDVYNIKDKGWKGRVCERLIGLSQNNKKAPNGLGWELKSVEYKFKDGFWVPKETMSINMLNPEEFLRDSFLESHLWNKLKSLIFCPTSCDEKKSSFKCGFFGFFGRRGMYKRGRERL